MEASVQSPLTFEICGGRSFPPSFFAYLPIIISVGYYSTCIHHRRFAIALTRQHIFIYSISKLRVSALIGHLGGYSVNKVFFFMNKVFSVMGPNWVKFTSKWYTSILCLSCFALCINFKIHWP